MNLIKYDNVNKMSIIEINKILTKMFIVSTQIK